MHVHIYQLVFAVQCSCNARAVLNSVNPICMGANVPPCVMMDNTFQVRTLFVINIYVCTTNHVFSKYFVVCGMWFVVCR